MTKSLLLTLVLSISIATPLVIYLTPTDEYDVVLKDGERFKAKHVNWYSSGHVDITKESGERILVPESQIKQIKVIEDDKH